MVSMCWVDEANDRQKRLKNLVRRARQGRSDT